MPTMDNINQLIEDIQKDKHNYVIGIIKDIKGDENKQIIEIFTNINESGLDKLLRVLKDHKKSLQKKSNMSIIEDESKNKNS